MKTRKKLSLILLCVATLLCNSTSVLALEHKQLTSEHEQQADVDNAIVFDFNSIDFETIRNNNEDVTINLENGIQITIGTAEPMRQRLLAYKTLNLTGPNAYHFVTSDTPILDTSATIINYDTNPDAISAAIDHKIHGYIFINNIPRGGRITIQLAAAQYSVHVAGSMGTYEICVHDLPYFN